MKTLVALIATLELTSTSLFETHLRHNSIRCTKTDEIFSELTNFSQVETAANLTCLL